MLEEIVIKYVIPALIPVIGTFFTWGMAELTRFIRVKTKRESIAGAFDQLSEFVDIAVSDVTQTLVKDLKVASFDGKLTFEEKGRLKSVAIDKVLEHLPASTKKILDTGVSSLQEFISGKIEQAVLSKK